MADAGAEEAEAAEEAAEAEAAGAAADVQSAVRAEWEEAEGAHSAAGLRRRAAVIAVARAIAVAEAKLGPRRGPAATVRAV